MRQSLREELLRRSTLQRTMIIAANAKPSLWNSQQTASDTRYLKGVVEQFGWPKISDVGRDGAQAAWQLLQLADDDPAFQVSCLALLRELPPNEVAPRNVAYLEDRILARSGEPQRYGTQHGGWSTSIDDQSNLDDRRRSVGLEPYSVEARRAKKSSS
jgi:hypothetical protein